jgi:hypothetical protein
VAEYKVNRRVDRFVLVADEPLHLLGLKAQAPRVLAVRMLLEAGRLHNAVQRHELRDHEPSHRA